MDKEVKQEIDREYTYAILHCHTELSTCTTNVDSVTSYGEYIDRAVGDGLYGVTFTEHGNVFEWFHKKQCCEKVGFKYIHAVEAYITEDEPWFQTKGKDPPERHRDNYHCCLYARNHNGFRELNRLVSQSFNRADVDVVPGAGVHYYYRPRITYSELKATSDNIIVSTACMAGILSEGPDELQSDFIEWLTEHRDRCYLEVQHHPCEAQAQYNRKLADLSHRTGIPLLACTDTHSLNADKALGRSVLQKSKKTFFENEADWDLTYKTYDELVAAFEKQGALTQAEYTVAIQNTLVLTDSCEEYEIDCGKKYPHIYDDPVGTFKHKINEAYKKHPYVKERYSFKEFSDRIKWEFDTYEKVGAIDFMLLQVYLREWEHKNGIQCGYGRGSVSGSEIAYVLGITEMDSMKYGLNFTRFMNASRVTNADIDTDYSEEDRDKVKQFLLRDHMNLDNIKCSEIVTFNSIKERGAIRDIGRALQIPLKEVDQIADLAERDPNGAKKKYPELFEIVDIVDGTIVSMGTHPSGVLVSDLNLAEEVGLCSSGSSKYPISMLNMKELDTQFYVKLDVLGLCNIRMINETCKLANIPRMGPDTVDVNDENVWKSIRDDTTGIFQWESESAQAFLRKMFSDRTIAIAKSVNPNFSYMKLLSFANGLIRPGCASFRDSVASGEIVTTDFKELDESLITTFGHVAMQEDILALLKNFAGYNDVEADNVRRCVDGDALIQLENGCLKKLKNVCVGDMVACVDDSKFNYDLLTLPKIIYRPVKQVFDNGIRHTLYISSDNGSSVCATHDHLVYGSKERYGINQEWIQLGEIGCGCSIAVFMDDNQYVREDIITDISIGGYKHVYDIEVEDYHNYFAGGILVHNCIAKKYGTESQLNEIHDRFISYSHEQYGVPTDKLEEIFIPLRQGILDASDYAFSWNHSDAYSMIGYISGYLRYYYPREFITSALNTFSDKPEKTLVFTEYAKKVGIPIKSVTFRHSRAEYSCDETSIYKGIASIKHLNKRAADDLYGLRDRQYASFIDLLVDIKEHTWVDSQQLDILIHLDFFAEFGDVHRLLAIRNLFAALYGRSSIRKEDPLVEQYGTGTIEHYSGKITDKQYMQFDSVGFLREAAGSVTYTPCTVFDRIQYESDYLGYITHTIPDITDTIYYVTDVKQVYKNYIVALYQLNSGQSVTVKVKGPKMNAAPIKTGNVIRSRDIHKERKWKRDADGKWIRSDEREDIMAKWNFIDTSNYKGEHGVQ